MRKNGKHSNRWTFVCGDWLPELALVGFDDLYEAIALQEHSHRGAFEFVWIERGRAAWQVGQDVYETGAGDVFITKPDEIHKGRYDIIEPCRFWWLVLQMPGRDTKACDYGTDYGNTHLTESSRVTAYTGPAGWLQTGSAELAALAEALWGLPRIIHIGPEAGGLFRRLRLALERQSQHAKLAARTAVTELALLLVEGRSPDTHDRTNGVIARIDAIVESLVLYLNEPLSVPEMARKSGLSESHFFRVFRERTGFTPHDYMRNLRIEEACRLLETTERTVTEIAIDLGFATSQHFATAFKRMKLRTPTEWRSLRT